MAKKKYYAVRAGRTPGIYTSWDACKAQVDGFANASFKSFPTKEEAEAFLGNNTKENKIEDEALAYVDGSYNVKTGEYSCGVVFFFEGEKTEYCEKGTDSGTCCYAERGRRNSRSTGGNEDGGRTGGGKSYDCP